MAAINLMNAEDGGQRRCICVTNNEVSDEEAKALASKGISPGDEKWEKFGIARYVTWPRIVCSIKAEEAQMMQEAQQRNTEITYTVAECGEFHSMGAYHEGISTIEEAKALFEGIRENHSNMIPAVGINIHEAGTLEIDDVQMDVLYGNSIDLDDLRYFPQIWNDQEGLSKIGQIIDAFPDAKVVGELPGLTVQDKVQPDMDAVKPVYVDEAAKLAAEIDLFSSDFDPYEL